jgi:hypothetical protein
MVAPPGIYRVIHGAKYGPSVRDGGAYPGTFFFMNRLAHTGERNSRIDITAIPAFPHRCGRATIRPARLRRCGAAAWRVEDRQCDYFEVRLVRLGRKISIVDACLGHVFAFGGREQSRF